MKQLAFLLIPSTPNIAQIFMPFISVDLTYFHHFPYFYLRMWRAMNTSHYTFMRPLQHFLTYKCRSPKD